VPGRLLVEGGALATADRVRASEGLLRAAIYGELYGATLLIFATLALYQLFKRVDQKTSTLMAAMMLVSVPISRARRSRRSSIPRRKLLFGAYAIVSVFATSVNCAPMYAEKTDDAALTLPV